MGEEGDRRAGPAPVSAAPAAPRSAATVILARDSATAGVEIYLVQRHRSIGFMGGMHVFPGGKVAPSDGSPRMRARIAGDVASSRHELWGDGVDRAAALDRVVAAVRETFEEAGVLLADGAAACDCPSMRARLNAGVELGALLEEAGLSVPLSQLEPFSRWITPESEPVRFDTSFYVARAPEGQHAEHDATESVAGLWATPAGALEMAVASEIRLAPPTALTLEALKAVDSVAAALALAKSRRPPTILPIIRTVGQEVVIYYPGDPEHPVKTRAMEGATRRIMRRL